jgi:hypothetical protein
MTLPKKELEKRSEEFFKTLLLKFMLERHPAAIMNPSEMFKDLRDENHPMFAEFQEYADDALDKLHKKVMAIKKKKGGMNFEF